MSVSVNDSQSDEFLKQGAEKCKQPDFPQSDLDVTFAYGFVDFEPEQATFRHQQTCAKRYAPSADPNEKTGYDCPVTHPEIYRGVGEKLGKDYLNPE